MKHALDCTMDSLGENRKRRRGLTIVTCFEKVEREAATPEVVAGEEWKSMKKLGTTMVGGEERVVWKDNETKMLHLEGDLGYFAREMLEIKRGDGRVYEYSAFGKDDDDDNKEF
jgi:hypothetical protein